MIPFMKFRATKTNPSRKKAGERLPGAEGSQRGTGTLWRRRGAHRLDCCPGFAGVHSRENVSSVRLQRAPLIVRQVHFSTAVVNSKECVEATRFFPQLGTDSVSWEEPWFLQQECAGGQCPGSLCT